MKKILSLILAIMMLVSCIPVAFAAETPSTMLYNGVELPDINTVWTDKETYPYAYIAVERHYNGDLDTYRLFLSTAPAKEGSNSRICIPKGSTICEFIIEGDATEFTLLSNQAELIYDRALLKGFETYEVEVIWGSADIYDTDKTTVYLAASDPIPVGGTAPEAGTNDHSQGTQVIYEAKGAEAYTITVPALMAPGDTAQVSVAGKWDSSRKLVVTADENVVLKNSINAADTKTLAVTFAGFDLAGSNTAAMSGEKDITVAEMPADALFGTWSGVITYEAGIVDVQ